MYRGLNVYFSPSDDAYVAIGTQLANPYFQQFPKGANLSGETREQYIAKHPGALSNSLTGFDPYAQQQPQNAQPFVSPFQFQQPVAQPSRAKAQVPQEPENWLEPPQFSIQSPEQKEDLESLAARNYAIEENPTKWLKTHAPNLISNPKQRKLAQQHKRKLAIERIEYLNSQPVIKNISPAEINELQEQAKAPQIAAPQRYPAGLEEPHVEQEQKQYIEQAMQSPVAYAPEMKQIAEQGARNVPHISKDPLLKQFPEQLLIGPLMGQKNMDMLRRLPPYEYDKYSPGNFPPDYRSPGWYDNKKQIKDDFKTLADELESSMIMQGNPEAHRNRLREELNQAKHLTLKAADFYRKKDYSGYGEYQDKWFSLSPADKKALIAQEPILKQERRKLTAATRQEQQAQQQLARWKELPPAERQQISVNHQVNDLIHKAQLNQHNQQQNFFTPQQLQQENVSPMILQEIMNNSRNQQSRYVPVKPRRSISDKVMSNFDARFLSPEFIPEEGNGY